MPTEKDIGTANLAQGASVTDSKRDERLWWLVLVDAEIAGEMGGEECLLFTTIACKARVALRDLHGIDLDDLSVEARERFHSLLEEQRMLLRAEKQRRADFAAIVDQAERLLGRVK